MNGLWMTIFLVLFKFSIECPDDCENGYCDEKGYCVCYPGYYGGVCPYGEALQVSPLGDLNNDGKIDSTRVKTELYPKGMGIKEWDINDAIDRPHSYRECSNAGKCNRLTGVCKCREGFEGSACQRRKCRPNDYADVKDCNGKGVCVSSDDYIRIATQGSAGSNSWELKKYNRCLCDNGWKGRYCEKRVCNKGYDPKYYETLFQFGYTLQDADGGSTAPEKESTISHYLAFTYNGMTYKTPIIDSYKGICSGGIDSKPGVLNVDLGILFKEELKKKLKYLPYFTPVDISLSCSGDKNEKVDITKISTPNTHSNGKFLTVVLTLDYIDVTPILSMELNVYKTDDNSALVYGIERAEYDVKSIIKNQDKYGTFQPDVSQAVWLIKYNNLVGSKDNPCYSNHRFETGKFPSYPLDISKECSTSSGQFNIYFSQATNPLGFPVKGQLECSGRGICNEKTGECECISNYHGSACNRISNY